MNSPDAPAGVRLDVEGRVARVTLDRRDRHNALRATEVAQLHSMLDEIEAREELRVLVLSGSGPTFCSGASLAQMESGEMSGSLFETLTDRLAEVRIPTICALNGSVYGGGAELALCCDFRIGVEGIRLRVTAARLGVCYPLGGLTRYIRRLGQGAAARILLAAEELSAEEMLRVGFLTQLTTRERFAEAVEERATRLASLAPLAVQSMKRILRDVERGAPDADEARTLIALCGASEDLSEGLAAWRERREPEFTGR